MEEYCDGSSASCPKNIVRSTGTECSIIVRARPTPNPDDNTGGNGDQPSPSNNYDGDIHLTPSQLDAINTTPFYSSPFQNNNDDPVPDTLGTVAFAGLCYLGQCVSHAYLCAQHNGVPCPYQNSQEVCQQSMCLPYDLVSRVDDLAIDSCFIPTRSGKKIPGGGGGGGNSGGGNGDGGNDDDNGVPVDDDGDNNGGGGGGDGDGNGGGGGNDNDIIKTPAGLPCANMYGQCISNRCIGTILDQNVFNDKTIFGMSSAAFIILVVTLSCTIIMLILCCVWRRKRMAAEREVLLQQQQFENIHQAMSPMSDGSSWLNHQHNHHHGGANYPHYHPPHQQQQHYAFTDDDEYDSDTSDFIHDDMLYAPPSQAQLNHSVVSSNTRLTSDHNNSFIEQQQHPQQHPQQQQQRQQPRIHTTAKDASAHTTHGDSDSEDLTTNIFDKKQQKIQPQPQPDPHPQQHHRRRSFPRDNNRVYQTQGATASAVAAPAQPPHLPAKKGGPSRLLLESPSEIARREPANQRGKHKKSAGDDDTRSSTTTTTTTTTTGSGQSQIDPRIAEHQELFQRQQDQIQRFQKPSQQQQQRDKRRNARR